VVEVDVEVEVEEVEEASLAWVVVLEEAAPEDMALTMMAPRVVVCHLEAALSLIKLLKVAQVELLPYKNLAKQLGLWLGFQKR
jgi:hypothetical protein